MVIVQHKRYQPAKLIKGKELDKLEAKERPRALSKRRHSLSQPRTKRNIFSRHHAQPATVQTGPLFEKLPAELRAQVFSHVFGSREDVLHVFNKTLASGRGAKIKHIACRRQHHPQYQAGPFVNGMTCPACPYSTGKLPNVITPDFQDAHPGLGLLKSCRQAYKEGIDMLYSSNKISFDDPKTFLHFTHSIFPHRLAQITTVQLLWNISDSEPKRYEAQHIDESHILDLRRHYDPFIHLLRSSKMPKLNFVKILVQWDRMINQDDQDRLWMDLNGWTGLEALEIVVSNHKGQISLTQLGRHITAKAVEK